MKNLNIFLKIAQYVLSGFIGALLFYVLNVETTILSLILIVVSPTLLSFLIAIELRVDTKKTGLEEVSTSLEVQTKYDARVIEAAFEMGVKCTIRADSFGTMMLWSHNDPTMELALCKHYYVGHEPGKKAVEKAFDLEMEAVRKFAVKKTADVST